jgi:hypothetical protein
MRSLINIAVWCLVIAALGYQGYQYILDERIDFGAAEDNIVNIVSGDAQATAALPPQISGKAQVIDGDTFDLLQFDAARPASWRQHRRYA